MPNWFEGVLKLRGPFNRILDFIWNGGLDLTKCRDPEYKQKFIETFEDWRNDKDSVIAEMVSDLYYSYKDLTHVKGTNRCFVILGSCRSLDFSKFGPCSYHLRDMCAAKLGLGTPKYIDLSLRVMDGIPITNMVYKYTQNNDTVVEFDFQCAWDVDRNIVNSAVKFGIDIKIEGVEPGLQFYRTCEFTRFGETKVFKFRTLTTTDSVWNCPYPIPF